MTKLIKAILLLFFMLSANMGFSQGDEDKEMYNDPKTRDQKAMDKATSTWLKEYGKNKEQRLQWWREAKFGMFIHWGVYSVPGQIWKDKKLDGYGEHIMRTQKITRAEYLDIAKGFNPEKFNAETWIKDAKKAGMHYFIVTAKHHDGFAMYPTKIGDFSMDKQTPFKRDPMAELAAACKKYGLKFGFYYSHAFDWEHPDAPGNDWELNNPGGDKQLFGGRDWYDSHPEKLPQAIKYVNEKAIPQIQELINMYHPDILWFDTPHKLPMIENLRILKSIWDTDRNIVVNGRLAATWRYNFGDYKNTADRPAEFGPVAGDWEAIPTTNESYGYSKVDMRHKPVSFFVRLLASAASGGGNLLMNIGPMGDGAFDPKDREILDGIGKWMDKNEGSIYKTTRSILPRQNWGVSTTKNDLNLIYLHVFNWPSDGKLNVGGIKGQIKKAYLLADKSKKNLNVKRLNPLDIQIGVPTQAPDAINSVIVLETGDDIETDKVMFVAANSPTRLLAIQADRQGDGFSGGDGKADNYHLDLKTLNQALIWKIRNNEPLKYQMSLKQLSYTESGGVLGLDIDGVKTEHVISPSTKSGMNNISLDILKGELQPGTHTIKVYPVKIEKRELVKLLELQLAPIQ